MFIARTIVQRTQPGQRQTVKYEEYFCHVYVKADSNLAGIVLADSQVGVCVRVCTCVSVSECVCVCVCACVLCVHKRVCVHMSAAALCHLLYHCILHQHHFSCSKHTHINAHVCARTHTHPVVTPSFFYSTPPPRPSPSFIKSWTSA